MSSSEAFMDQIASSLGADRVVALPDLPSCGPLDLLTLRRRLAQVQDSVAAHQLPVSNEAWKLLETLAAEFSAEGQPVTPDVLASVLLEQGLKALRASRPQAG